MATFIENERETTRMVNKALLCILLIYPILILCTFLKLIDVRILDLVVITLLSCVLGVMPTVLEKKGVPTQIVKYFGLIAMQAIITLMATRVSIGICITYILAVAVSCLYVDVIVTRNITIIGYVMMLAGLGIRASGEAARLAEEVTSLKWFAVAGIGFTIEYVLLSVAFFQLLKRMKRMLKRVSEVEKVKSLMKESEESADELKSELNVLVRFIHSMEDYVKKLADVTNQSMEGFYLNKSRITHSMENMQNLNDIIEGISLQTDSLLDIADETSVKSNEFAKTMVQASDSLKKIETANEVTKKAAEGLDAIMQEVMKFSEIIGQLSAQTNILAINASIEAARAGEDGRGFAVVATQVGELAMESKEAAQNIIMQITEMQDEMDKVMESVRNNTKSIAEGIGYIEQVKEGAKHLGDLQETSKNKAKQIVKECEDSKNYSEKMTAVTSEMMGISEKSIEEASYIGDYLEEGNESINKIRASFDRVGDTVDKLKLVTRQ